MMRKLAALASILAVCALATALYAQQDLGRIEGSVADKLGTAIPGAAVSLWSDTRNAHELSDTRSDEAGNFVFTDLIPGRFVVRVESEGFVTATEKTAVQSGLTTAVAIVLEIGAIPEKIEITGAPLWLEATR
jgi:hypothetical protein